MKKFNTALLPLVALSLSMAVGNTFADAPLAACNEADSVGNGGDLTEGSSNGSAQGLGFDVGSGICNGSFTVTLDNSFPSSGGGTETGIELGIRSNKRFVGYYVRDGLAANNYEVDTGYRDGDLTKGSIWGFQTSVAYDGLISDLDALTLYIETADGSSVPADFGTGSGVFDLLLLRGPFEARHGSPFNPTPEWDDLFQMSQAPAFFTFGWILNADENALYDATEEGAWWFRLVAEKDGQTAEVEVCIHTPNSDCDSDGDGVNDGVDECPATLSSDPNVPTRRLGVNRWIWEDSDWVTNARGSVKDFNMDDTRGCSCEQILDVLLEETGNQHKGHYKFGCSSGLVEDWIESFD